jgi:hypothetical protein
MKNYELKIIVNEGGKEYERFLTLKAENLPQLNEKLSALYVLNQALKHEDLIVSTELIREKPQLIPVIKDIINQTEDKSEAWLLTKGAARFVPMIINALK